MTDAELIDRTIKEVMAAPLPPSVHVRDELRPPPGLPGPVEVRDMWVPPANPVYYRNVDEFKSVNPQCCRIARRYEFDDSYPDDYGRIFGARAALVVVNYKIRYREDGELIEEKINLLLRVSNCGCIIR